MSTKAPTFTIGILWRDDSRSKKVGEPDRSGAIWDHCQMLRATKLMKGLHLKFVVVGYTAERRAKPTSADIGMLIAGIAHSGDVENDSIDVVMAEELAAATPPARQVDLILFPGTSAEGEQDEDRKAAQVLLMHSNFGVRPILAICGALYWLDGFHGLKLQPVDSHSWSQMIDYSKSLDKVTHPGNKVVSNVQVHKLNPSAASEALFGTDPFDVNSVHNRAFVQLPASNAKVAFTALAESGEVIPLEDGKPRNSRGKVLNPERCIEAFIMTKAEMRAPLVAVQWHIEAYAGNGTPENPNTVALRRIIEMLASTGGYVTKERFKEFFPSGVPSWYPQVPAKVA
jgi:gamma-glutamyl-gamma-aminobutyrate hydrolase PuuD